MRETDSLLQKESDVLEEIDTVYKTLYSDDFGKVTLSEARYWIYRLDILYKELLHIKTLLHDVEIQRASGTVPPWE